MTTTETILGVLLGASVLCNIFLYLACRNFRSAVLMYRDTLRGFSNNL